MVNFSPHEVHYVNATGYWLVMMDVAQKLAFDEGTIEEGMVSCLASPVELGKVAKRVLTMRMDYYQLSVISGASFAAQMTRSIEAPMTEIQSAEFPKATKEYQNSKVHQVVKMAAKGEAAISIRAHEEGAGPAAGKN